MSRLLVVGEAFRANAETLNNSAAVVEPLQTRKALWHDPSGGQEGHKVRPITKRLNSHKTYRSLV